MKTKEEIYDEQISPLMEQIIEICKENKIPVIGSFDISGETGEDDDLFCSTYIHGEDYPSPVHFVKASHILLPKERPPMMINTHDKDEIITSSAVFLN